MKLLATSNRVNFLDVSFLLVNEVTRTTWVISYVVLPRYQVPCVLRYWDNIQKCYITYRSFFLLETSPSSLSFPDPVTSNPAEIMVAEEWQIVVDVAPDIEYPDENRFVLWNSDITICQGSSKIISFHRGIVISQLPI